MKDRVETSDWADQQKRRFQAEYLDYHPVVDKDSAEEELAKLRKAGKKHPNNAKFRELEQKVLDGNPFTSALAIDRVREQLKALSENNSTPTLITTERSVLPTRIDSLKTALAKIALIGPVLIRREGEKALHGIDDLFKGLANLDERDGTIEKVRVLYEEQGPRKQR
jgi:predicted aspartyl protease